MTNLLTVTPAAEETLTCQIRAGLKQANTLTVAVVGPPGAGKTELLEATARALHDKATLAFIVVNPAADRDAERLGRYCKHVETVKAAAPGAGLLTKNIP